MLKLDRRDWIALFAITALAALLRFYKLGIVPPGFQFDEAFNALDAARVMAGDRPLFLPMNGGREVFYTYFQVALSSILGLNLYTLRLASALAGILTVPAAYLLLRAMLIRDSRRIAALTSLALAVSFWHLFFSHYGIRVIFMPLIFSGVIGFFWLGSRSGKVWPYLLSGILAGLGVWNNPTARLIPFVLAGFVAWLWWQHPEQRGLRRSALQTGESGSAAAAAARSEASAAGSARRAGLKPLGGLLVAGLAAFLVFLPLGLEFLRHPDFFFGHPEDVSVFAERVHGGSPVLALLANALRVLAMFNLRGDALWTHNLAGRPVFDPLLSIPFLIGAALWLRRLIFGRDDPDRDALLLLGLWSFVMLLPSVFSDMAPNFSRTLPSLPAVFVASGLGLAWILAFAESRNLRLAGQLVVAAILALSGGLAVRDYFVRFPQAPDVYYAFDVDKLDAFNALQPLTAGNQVYLAQLWAEHATIDFLRREGGIKSLDSSDTLVLPPPGQGAVYAFPAEQEDRARRLADRWPAARLETIPDRQDAVLLVTVTLPAEVAAAQFPESPPLASFAGAPSLLAAEFEPASGEIWLAWRAEQPMSRSLTSFVHLLDRNRRLAGQVDKLPGNGSYLTTAWTSGERVVERYRPAVDACAAGEPLDVLAGWYDLSQGAQPLPRADAPGVTALAGSLVLPATSRPAGQLQLDQPLDVSLDGGLILQSFRLAGVDLQPGSPVTLDLAWRGDPAAAGKPLAVELAGAEAGGPLTLWEGPLLPEDVRWQPGEAICRRLRLQLPPELAPGDYELQVLAGGQAVPLTGLTLGPSTRRFDPPSPANPADALLDGQIRLLGADLESPAADQPLAVTLAWQAAQPPAASYTVFVHLLDPAGQLVAQSDAVPAGGYATNRWLADEVVLDRHELALPAGLAPGRYQLLAGMYDPASGRRLPAQDAASARYASDAVPVGEVELP